MLDLGLKVAPILISIGAIVLAFIRTRRDQVDERFKLGGDRMDRHESRIQSLEQTVAGMPAKEDLHGLELKISTMTGAIQRIEATVASNRDTFDRFVTTMDRVENYLLNHK